MKITAYLKTHIQKSIQENSVSGARLRMNEKPTGIIVSLGEIEEIEAGSLLGSKGTVDAISFTASMRLSGATAAMHGFVWLNGLGVAGDWTE